MGNILDDILQTKRGEVARARARRPLHELRASLKDAPPPRDFHAALAVPPVGKAHLIAEIKRKSPSAGLIRPDLDPPGMARIYHQAGASALSVLTDEVYFDGRLQYLEQVKEVVPLPVLRKDFIIDAYQVYESRCAGADAILLIGEVLDVARMRDFLELSHDLGMTTLLEVHEAQTLAAVQEVIGLPCGRRCLLGINNRNLKIQQTDLGTTTALSALVPKDLILVSESGIQTPADVDRVVRAGARALLIGETLLKAPDIGAKARELLGTT